MSITLIIAEHRHSEILPATYECVTAAQGLALPVTVAVIGADMSLAQKAAGIAGVTTVLAIETKNAEFDSDVTRAVVDELIRDLVPRILLAPHSVQSMNYLAAVAARNDLPLLTDVTRLAPDGAGAVAERPCYGGKTVAEIAASGSTVAVTLRAGSVEPAVPGGTAEIRTRPHAALASRTVHLGFVTAEDDGVDIAKANVLLSIGRGVGEEEAIGRFSALADRMGAMLSVSRPLVDAGWMPVSRQVGQSGRSVAPKIYLAFGISGAPQHLAGIKKAGKVIAINKDPEAPIFGIAQYGAHCDLHDVADELERQLA